MMERRDPRRSAMRRLPLLALSLFVCLANAQSYPAKPVKLIVTYPPGGSSDLMARVFGAKLAEMWGQQVIVESKPGAAGSIGMGFDDHLLPPHLGELGAEHT